MRMQIQTVAEDCEVVIPSFDRAAVSIAMSNGTRASLPGFARSYAISPAFGLSSFVRDNAQTRRLRKLDVQMLLKPPPTLDLTILVL